MSGRKTSKSWFVTAEDGTEVKVTGVTSPEAAIEKALKDGFVGVSARPVRVFKSASVVAEVPGGDETP